jgi:Dolichyl-phosphate-mannose-protein mannosyltransferase
VAARGRRAAALSAFGLLGLALFWISRGKWADPLIDSGREWIVPDTLARGGLLYRDVVYWFGPLTPYWQAAFLRLFGSGFGSLVLSGAAVSIAILLLLWTVLRRVTGRAEAALWTLLSIPALVFMPNAGGALLGMGYRIWHAAAFALAAVAIASAAPRSKSALGALAAGACAALAGLCRTEWGLAALAAAVLALWLRPLARRRGLADPAAAALGFAAVFALGVGVFLLAAGRSAVIADGHVLLTGLPTETRHFLFAFSGVRDWRSGLIELVYSAAMWVGLFVLAALLAARPAERRRRARALGAILAVLVLAAAFGGAGGAVLFSASPLVCLAGLIAGIRRRGGAAGAALAACGLLGFLVDYRRPFHIGDSAYVGPPLLFAFVCAAGLVRLATARERARQPRLRMGAALRWTIAALVAFATAGRVWQYATLESSPIAGTSGMLGARPELAREIEALGRTIRDRTRADGGLVVFPEGELLNLLSGRANPVRHKLYLPGYLTDGNEPAVLAELESTRPEAIVIWHRPTSEYGRDFFGRDYARSIRDWIGRNYRLTPFRAPGTPRRTNPRFTIGLRREGS